MTMCFPSRSLRTLALILAVAAPALIVGGAAEAAKSGSYEPKPKDAGRPRLSTNNDVSQRIEVTGTRDPDEPLEMTKPISSMFADPAKVKGTLPDFAWVSSITEVVESDPGDWQKQSLASKNNTKASPSCGGGDVPITEPATASPVILATGEKFKVDTDFASIGIYGIAPRAPTEA